MPKNKPNKGLLKRVRISKNGKFKMMRGGGRHLRSHKSGKLMRSYRKDFFVAPAEAKRLSAMLFMPAGGRKLRAKAETAAAAE